LASFGKIERHDDGARAGWVCARRLFHVPHAQGEPRGGKPCGGGNNGELISSGHNLGQVRWVPSKGAVARTIQRRLRFLVHSFEVDTRDQHIGNAGANRATRIRSTQHAIQPEIDFGAVGVRPWPKRYCGRLYNAVFRYWVAGCQQLGRTVACAPGSFRSNIGCECCVFRCSLPEYQLTNSYRSSKLPFQNRIRLSPL
jgi:hypothetical protein